MHPQIRQNEPGDCPICGMDLIPLSENGSSDPLVLEMTPEAIQLASIETTTISTGTATEGELLLSGKIQEDERLAASQVAHIGGRIEKLFVSFEGETVSKGQKVAALYSPELIAAQRELLEAKKLESNMPGLVEAARRKLAYWKVSPQQISEIEESGNIKETFILYADASGIVKNRRVSVGDYVQQGQVLLDLINLNRLWVIFDAYEEDLSHINTGDQILFTTPAIPGEVFTTRINFIDPVVDPKTRVVSLRGEVSNTKRFLKPDMFVKGALETQASAQANVQIPKSAVLWTGTRSVVYVKKPNTSIPSFQYREVELGERLGSMYEVKKGLDAGEEVVTQGAFSIDAAAQLNNQASMMNQLVNQESPDPVALPNYQHLTSAEFKKQLSSLITPYMQIKDALVDAKADEATEGGKALLGALNAVDMTLLKDSSHLYWMDQYQTLNAHTKGLIKNETLEGQREQFGFLSHMLIQTYQVFGVEDDTLYVQHCPMAFDNQGADWLSTEEQILNPYFGDMMLRCGSVQETLGPDAVVAPSSNKTQQHFHNH